MNNKIMMPTFIACLLVSTMALAAGGSVTITSPAEGTTVSSSDKIKLSYEAVPGPEGDHLHLNVDSKRMAVLRQLKGSAEIDPLTPGKHLICLAINTKAHVPVGAEKCVSVTAK